MATNLRVNSDSCKSAWTLHSFEATRTNEHGLGLVLVQSYSCRYVWTWP